jgi:protein tyrosine/serine phosphatase
MGVDKEYDIREEDNGAHFKDGFERHAILNYDIIDEANYGGVRAALTSLMNDVIAGNSVYFHCTHGSDRTGTLAYLTEALLGVSDEDRNRDFDLTSLSGRADRNRYYDHMVQYFAGHNSNRKYVYMVTNLPNEEAVREWYFRGSEDRAADEKLIEDFKNAILE